MERKMENSHSYKLGMAEAYLISIAAFAECPGIHTETKNETLKEIARMARECLSRTKSENCA